MMPTTSAYVAVFLLAAAGDRGDHHVLASDEWINAREYAIRVEGWADGGEALVVDGEAGTLVPARSLPGFQRIARTSSAQYLTALPGDGWQIRTPHEPPLTVLCWLVSRGGGLTAVTLGGGTEVSHYSTRDLVAMHAVFERQDPGAVRPEERRPDVR